MYKEISKLIIFGAMPSDSILVKMSDIFRQFTDKTMSKDDLIKEIYTQIKRLLTIATDYGFDGNLWQNYLTFLLVTTENPFSITC